MVRATGRWPKCKIDSAQRSRLGEYIQANQTESTFFGGNVDRVLPEEFNEIKLEKNANFDTSMPTISLAKDRAISLGFQEFPSYYDRVASGRRGDVAAGYRREILAWLDAEEVDLREIAA